jgi:predicted dehydrogenase
VERFSPEASYAWQLRAFAAALRGQAPVATTAADAVSNMRVIDAIYAKAGLKPRGLQSFQPSPAKAGEGDKAG